MALHTGFEPASLFTTNDLANRFFNHPDMQHKNGLSSEIWTHGLLVPNQALYRLSYT